jgi:cytochrome b6-f complex iron-sulfur subunit/menaquinol-cytochrome c reductase iron-sulfur subunit
VAADEDTKKSPEAPRRGALKALVIGGTAVACSALAVPAVRFVVEPATAGGGAGGGKWVRTVRLDSLREGEPRRVAIVADHRDAWELQKQVELGAAWLVRRGDTVSALNVTCPHLGCAIARGPSGDGYACPCHDSAFDADGKRLGGPSPRDLDRLATRIEDGFVLVDFRQCRQGITDKVEIG